MGEGVVVILVLRAADDAPRRVGDVGSRTGQRRVHAEKAHPVRRAGRERGGQRAVGVEADRGVRRVLQSLADGAQGVRHLAVAVELVAEHVGHHADFWRELAADAAEGRLVALDDGQLLLRPAEEPGVGDEIRRDAPLQVGAGAVGEAVAPGVAQHLFQHPAGGGLAVGAGDHRHGDAPRQAREHVRADAQRHLAGQGGAAPAQQAQREPYQLAADDGKHESHRLIYSSLSAPTEM